MSRTKTRYRPTLEVCEPRHLQSGFGGGVGARRVTAAFLEARSANNDNNDDSGGIGSVGPGGVPLMAQGQPTKHELARSRFRAYFAGPAVVGPGRFSDQAKLTYIRGIGGCSAFLHGDLNLGIVTPTDPNAPFTGFAVMQDKNQNSQGLLGLDLTGSRENVDFRGRPTLLTFNSDPNIFSGAFFVTSSTGTVRIRYHNGNAVVRFDGLLYASGLTNPLKNSWASANGGFKKA